MPQLHPHRMTGLARAVSSRCELTDVNSTVPSSETGDGTRQDNAFTRCLRSFMNAAQPTWEIFGR